MRALIVVTGAEALDESHPTGVWAEEYATLFTALCEAGVELEVASPTGGAAPVDPRSAPDDEAQARWRRAMEVLAQTRALDALSDTEGFDALVLPGGHGPLVDLAFDPRIAALVEVFARSERPVAALCHGPAALLGARTPAGAPLVADRRLTAFTNGEETLAGLQTVVPFLLETRLREAGARFEHALLPGGCHVTRDEWLLTGQNPASSAALARSLLEVLAERQRQSLGG